MAGSMKGSIFKAELIGIINGRPIHTYIHSFGCRADSHARLERPAAGSMNASSSSIGLRYSDTILV